MKIAQITKYIQKNWDKIPDKHKEFIKPAKYSENVVGLNVDEHFVILLLDRQKPSVEQSYNFDMERIGVTRTGKIVWGFVSGCSCPAPFDDASPQVYKCVKTYKEFEINEKDFDTNWVQDVLQKFIDIKKDVDEINVKLKTEKNKNGKNSM
jgi:hypothetical protein